MPWWRLSSFVPVLTCSSFVVLTSRHYLMPLMLFFAGEARRKGILYQYNEEIEGTKKDSFTLQGEGTYR